MKFLSLYLMTAPVALGSLFDRRAVCNADNCARAVTGTAGANGAQISSSRVNTDCSSFQRATAYPSASTITITSGSTSTTISPSLTATTVTPSSFPAYVSTACSNGGNPSSRFASACSCAGVTKTTTTVAIPTVTIVVPTPSNPNRGCNNPYSGSKNTVTTCSGLSVNGQTCYCHPDIDGSGYCGLGSFCGATCTKDADCPADSICSSDSYCPGNVCLDASAFVACRSSNNPSRLFRKAEVDARDEQMTPPNSM